MTKKKPERRSPKEGQRSSELDHCLGGTSCAQPAKVNVDDLVLCERHALEAKLEGQISCWEGILFHIDLWSREAARRDREDVVRLLEVQRVEAVAARHRAYADLDLARSEMPWKSTQPSRRGSLPLPPKAARPLSGGLRRLRRR